MNKMAVCIYGEMHTAISVDQFDDNVDIFACVKGNDPLPNRVISIPPNLHDTKFDMMERVAFLKRNSEITHQREYDIVYLCTPDNIQFVQRIPVQNHTLVAQIIPKSCARRVSINPNIVAGNSLTMDLVSLFNRHLERMSDNVRAYLTNGVNDDANLFYDYVCSRFLNYENCDLFKRAS